VSVRIVLRVVLAAVVLAAACLLLAPASLLDAPLAARTGERLRLADARGLWWHGHGVLAARDSPLRVPVAWRVALAPLLTGSLVVTFGGNDTAAPTGTLAIRDGSLDAHDLHIAVPATLVATLVPALSGIALRGEIDARAPAFAWRRGAVQGTIDATWQPATFVAGALPIDLGRVAVNARPAGEGIAGTVRNSGGALAIDGTVNVAGHVATASLKLTPNASASAAVRALLALAARPDDAGTVTLTWQSDLR
jgi:hypothetical protein